MTDWKKQAAQTLDAENVEKAFLDQSFTFVANKVGDLMNQPYCLGFEIIHKNDSNTRMVAIFAFKAGGQLLYVPVFFLNGEIKGQDLMYQVQQKAFVPSEPWAEYFLKKESSVEGIGVDKSLTRRQNRGMDLEKLRMPVGGAKHASLDELSEQRDVSPVLRDFLEQESPEFIEKLAKWVSEDFDFANDIYKVYKDLGSVIPFRGETEKKASAPTGIEVFTALDENVKSASDSQDVTRDILTQGYHIKDHRKEAAVNTIYEEGEVSMDTISDIGLYKVTLLDGGQKQGICAPVDRDMIREEDPYSSGDPIGTTACGEWDDQIKIPVLAVVYEDGTCFPPKKGIIGECVELADKMESKLLTDTPKAKKTYRILNLDSGKMSVTFQVLSRKKKSGVLCLEVVKDYCHKPITIRYNPDVTENDEKSCFFGANARFIEVKAEVTVRDPGKEYSSYHIEDKISEEPADNGDITRLVTAHGTKSASVRVSDMGAFTFEFKGGHSALGPMEKLSMHVALMEKLDISVEDAGEVVDKAEAKGFYNFGICPPLNKEASRITLEDEPEFDTSINSRFGLEQDFPQHFMINTDRDEEDFPRARIGDVYDPGMGHGPQEAEGPGLPMDAIMNAPPQELAAMAQSMGMPQVFDHGIVGSMVHTYDAVGMVDKWLPKLEGALDAMGRLIFLYYWKPGDFQDAYGVDDMEELENQLLSNFRSMGDMVMNLLQKSSRRAEGPAPLKKSN